MDREKEMLYRFVGSVVEGDLETVRLMLQHDRGLLSKTVQWSMLLSMDRQRW